MTCSAVVGVMSNSGAQRKKTEEYAESTVWALRGERALCGHGRVAGRYWRMCERTSRHDGASKRAFDVRGAGFHCGHRVYECDIGEAEHECLSDNVVRLPDGGLDRESFGIGGVG